MARTKSSVSASAQSLDIAASCAATPLLITADMKKEFVRLLQCTKNEDTHGKSRQVFKSALETLSINAAKTIWHNSHEQANLMTFCAEVLSEVVSTNNIDLIKLVFISLATWLVPESISKIADECQQFGWNTMRETYSTIIGNQKELGNSCRAIRSLIDGSKTQAPESFIDEELTKLLGTSDVLYASDAPEILWILRRKTSRQANHTAILYLIQKNIRNSTFLADFLNILHESNDTVIQATTSRFFTQLLPIFSLTYSFLPHAQLLKRPDNLSPRSEDDYETDGNPSQEEEELFDEWKKEWEHLEEDPMPEASMSNPAIEVHDGQRLFDEALGGKALALLIQAASRLGFVAETKQILGLAALKLGQTRAEQCHDILAAFLNTMMLRKGGRTILETHKADVRAMVTVYTYHYLTSPIDDMARPRSDCDCVRCKALTKFLEDPNLESKVFVNDTPARYQHLLQQVQKAHHRFTWEYRYGPNHVLSGESRARYPDTWSSELRKKRFPKQWVASKGYKCTTRENDVLELTVKKVSLAEEVFKRGVYKAEELEAKVAASRLGVSLWSDARKSARSIDRIGISQSHKSAAAEAKAKQLIATLAQKVARMPATPQSSSKMPASKGINTKKVTVPVPAAKTPTIDLFRWGQERPSDSRASLGPRTANPGKTILGLNEDDSAPRRTPNGDNSSTQTPFSQKAKPSIQRQPNGPKISKATQSNVATPSQETGKNASSPQHRGKARIAALSGRNVNKKGGNPSQPASRRSSQSSKRVVTNRRVIPDSDSDSDGDSCSDFEATRGATTKLASSASAPNSSQSRAAPVKPGPGQSAQRDNIREPNQSTNGQDRGYTSAMRSLQCGVWRLRADQVLIDLGPLALLDDDFLLSLDRLSKSSKVSWKDALAVLKEVQKERKEEERKRAVTLSKAWLSSDTTAALTRIITKRTEPLPTEPLPTEPLPMEPLPTEPVLTDNSSLSSLTTTPEIQSTTPPGDPPPAFRFFGSFAPVRTAVSRAASDSNEGSRDTLPGTGFTFQRSADTPSIPQAPPPLTGSRATGSRDGKDYAIAEGRHMTPSWKSSNARILNFGARSPIVPTVILESFKNGGKSGTGAPQAVHAAQSTTSKTTTEVSRTFAAPERPGMPTNQMARLSASATIDSSASAIIDNLRAVARPEAYVAPVAQMAPVSTNAGSKRSAEATGLSSNRGPDSTRRKSDAPKVPAQVEVIDLLDSDEEYVIPVAHLLPGHKKKPIAID